MSALAELEERLCNLGERAGSLTIGEFQDTIDEILGLTATMRNSNPEKETKTHRRKGTPRVSVIFPL